MAEGNGQPQRPPDPLESVMAGADHQVALADQLVKLASEANSLLADLIQVGAVPRKFDEPVLRLLIDGQPTDEEFSSAFSTFFAMPFVTGRRDGRYRMHEEIRRAMLARFEATDEGRKALAELNGRLADYYEKAHDRARMVADQFDVVSDLLRQVSPDRVPAMRSAVEDQLVRPLIEAQHHRTATDPTGAGLQYFHKSFELYEYEGRIEVCRLLLRSWWNDIEDLADDRVKALRNWNMAYEVRLAVDQEDGDRARQIADELMAQPGLDAKMKVQIQGFVTRSLMTECRFADALRATENEIASRGDHDPDPANRWVVFATQANIHKALFDREAQEVSLGLALEATQSAVARDAEAVILDQLAALHAEQGGCAEAASLAIQALHIVRTLTGPSAAIAAQRHAVQMMRTFGVRDPRLADLFHTEAVHLTRGDNVLRFVAVEGAFVRALTGTEQFERAHQVLDHVDARLGDQYPAERSQVLVYRANALEAEGRKRESVEQNRRTAEEAERQRGTKWSVAAALTNAATGQMRIGDLLDDACKSADKARDLWVEMGNVRGVALADVVRAEVARRRGDFAGAQAVLGAGPPLVSAGLEEAWYTTAANLAAALDSFDEAVGHINASLEIVTRSGHLRDAARANARLVEILLYAGRNEEAVAATRQLSDLMDELSTLRQYQQSNTSQRADEHSGRAVRLLSAGSGRPLDTVRSAVQHLDEAQSADPGPCWYALNQAYAYLRLGDKKSVRRSIELAATKAADTIFAEPIAGLSAKLAELM